MSLLERDGDGIMDGPTPMAPGILNLRGRNVCPGPALALIGASTWGPEPYLVLEARVCRAIRTTEQSGQRGKLDA